MTPGRTIAVAALTLLAALASAYASGFITALIVGCPCPNYGWSVAGHPAWHLSWAALTVPVALGVGLARKAWPATGWTARSLATAEVFALVSAVGNAFAGVGAAMPFPQDAFDWRSFVHPHNVGEVMALGSFAIVLFACVVMLAIGVRRALYRQASSGTERPTR